MEKVEILVEAYNDDERHWSGDYVARVILLDVNEDGSKTIRDILEMVMDSELKNARRVAGIALGHTDDREVVILGDYDFGKKSALVSRLDEAVKQTVAARKVKDALDAAAN
jgi:hypothetical protein